MEYLFAFQFRYCELCVENRCEGVGEGGGTESCFVDFCSLSLLQLSVGEGLRDRAENLI